MLWPLWPVIGCSFRATSQSIKYVKSRIHHKIMTWWWVKTSQGRYEHPKSPGDFLQKPGDKPQLLRRYLKHYRRCEFSYSIHVYIVYKCIVISVGYSDGPQFFGPSFRDFLGEGWQGVPRDSVRLVLLLPSQCHEINRLHNEPIPRLRWACEQQLQLHVSHGGLLGLGSYHELSTLRKSYKILIFIVCRSDMIRWFSQWKAEFITVYRGFPS